MFRFELEAVLNYRLQIEEQCQLSLADSLKRLQTAIDILNDLQRERKNLIRHLAKMQENSLSPDAIERHFMFIEYLKCKEEKQEAVVSGLKDEVSVKRQDLLEAVKRKKTMEALRDKKMAAYISEAAAKDRKELDEFAIIKFGTGMKK
ncbi:MAG TPA: flagellar export protein FliJ [Syntrophales bacterium]|nr:flagellar export protein FliJ [Syntrophales bacterium]